MRFTIPVAQKSADEHVLENETAGEGAGTQKAESRKEVKCFFFFYEVFGHFEKLYLCRQEEESDVTFL